MQTEDRTPWELPPVNNQSSQSQKAQEMQQSQSILPGAQRAQTLIEIALVSSEDCRDVLDLMFADLPSPVSAAMAPLVANRFAGGEGEVPPSFSLPPDHPHECTPSRKQPKEPSGDSSINSPDQEVWPDPLSISSPFLSFPQCICFLHHDPIDQWRRGDRGQPTHPKKEKG